MKNHRISNVQGTKRVGLFKIIAGMALATMIAGTAQSALSAYDDQDRPGIEGAWDVAVTIRQCDTRLPVAAVHAMNMFMQGGTLTETSNDLLRGASVGTWLHLNARRYTAVFRFFTFNADGSFAGRNKITRTIRLNEDANGFTANAVFDIFDVNDNVVASGCATETATRLED